MRTVADALYEASFAEKCQPSTLGIGAGVLMDIVEELRYYAEVARDVPSRTLDGAADEIERLRVRAESAEAALRELYEWALDACHQGTGVPFQSEKGWHMFMSTWEYADELLPRVAAALSRLPTQPHAAASTEETK